MIVERENIEIVKINWTALADAVESKVMAKMYADLAYWTEDRSMRAMLIADAADGLEVCELLAKGAWKPVEEKLWNMDTAARDYLYDYIDDVAGEDFFKAVRV
jgi:hypothetical protein